MDVPQGSSESIPTLKVYRKVSIFWKQIPPYVWLTVLAVYIHGQGDNQSWQQCTSNPLLCCLCVPAATLRSAVSSIYPILHSSAAVTFSYGFAMLSKCSDSRLASCYRPAIAASSAASMGSFTSCPAFNFSVCAFFSCSSESFSSSCSASALSYQSSASAHTG